MTIEADLQALETDASVWDGVSTALSGASTSASGLGLSVGELSFAGEVTGLYTTYTSYIEHVSGLLSGGSEETSTIASGLRQVKAAYEGAEGSNINQFDGLWDANSE